jgi:hypothetical protein
MISVGLVLLATGQVELGFWVVLSGLAGAVINAVLIVRGQHSMMHATALAVRDTQKRRRWVGAARVPSPLGYAVVTIPLAVLELAEARLVLRVRPGIVRMMFGIENLVVAPREEIVIYPARGWSLDGIEVRLGNQPSYYFWTKERRQVLAAAAIAGFNVSDQEQPTAWR